MAVWENGRLVDILVGKSRAMEWFAAHGFTKVRDAAGAEPRSETVDAAEQ
jgi:hypothetical protein